jgi:hypothetical protein
MHPIFQNTILQNQLYEYSHITLPMLTPSECKDLEKKIIPIIEKYKVANERKYHLTTLINSKEYVSFVWDEVFPIFDIFQKKYLFNYKIIVCNFIVKEPGGGEVNVHQDWTLCDNTLYKGITIWCPLIDLFDENIGILSIIPHSEKIGAKYISCPSAPHYFEDYAQELIPYHNCIKTKQGNAVCFEGACIHSSPPNATKLLRIAIQCTLIPKEATTQYYRFKANAEGNLLYRYDVEDDFYKYFFENKEKYRHKIPDEIIPHKTMHKKDFFLLHHIP